MKVIKLSQPAKEDTDWPKSRISRESLEKSQQWLRLHLQRDSDQSIFSILGQCFFFFVSNCVGLFVAAYTQKLCILRKAMSSGIDTELSDGDFYAQWAATIAYIFES